MIGCGEEQTTLATDAVSHHHYFLAFGLEAALLFGFGGSLVSDRAEVIVYIYILYTYIYICIHIYVYIYINKKYSL